MHVYVHVLYMYMYRYTNEVHVHVGMSGICCMTVKGMCTDVQKQSLERGSFCMRNLTQRH